MTRSTILDWEPGECGEAAVLSREDAAVLKRAERLVIRHFRGESRLVPIVGGRAARLIRVMHRAIGLIGDFRATVAVDLEPGGRAETACAVAKAGDRVRVDWCSEDLDDRGWVRHRCGLVLFRPVKWGRPYRFRRFSFLIADWIGASGATGRMIRSLA